MKFALHDDAKKAIDELNAKKELGGKMILVSKHISKQENQQTNKISQQIKQTFETNICVRFLPKNVTEE